MLLASLPFLRQARIAAPAETGVTSALTTPAPIKLTLTGDEAIEQIKEGGQYQSPGEAIQASFYRVEKVPNGDGFYANNQAQRFSIHFTAGAAQLSVKQAVKDQ